MKKITLALQITGAIMIALLLLGAFANSYGADIKINYVTILATPIFLVTLIVVAIKTKNETNIK